MYFIMFLFIVITNQILIALSAIVTTKYERIGQDLTISFTANNKSNGLSAFCITPTNLVCHIQLGNYWRLTSLKYKNFHCFADIQKKAKECKFPYFKAQNTVLDLIEKGDEIFVFSSLSSAIGKAGFEKIHRDIPGQVNERMSLMVNTQAFAAYSEGYVAFLDNKLHTLQVFNLKSSTNSQSCSTYNWAKYPAYETVNRLSPADSNILGVTVVALGQRVVACGGQVKSKITKKIYTEMACYFWQPEQGEINSMKYLANLTWPRIYGGGFAIDDESFAIIGGNSEAPSNVFDVFKSKKFETKNSTLPQQVIYPCFATTPNLDVVFLAALTNDKNLSFLAEIDKSTLESRIFPYPPRRMGRRFSCTLHQQKDMRTTVLVTTVNDKRELFYSQFLNVGSNRWTVMSHRANGKLPMSLQLLTYESKIYLFTSDVALVKELKIESNQVVPIKEKLLSQKMRIKNNKPVFITNEMGAVVCKGNSG